MSISPIKSITTRDNISFNNIKFTENTSFASISNFDKFSNARQNLKLSRSNEKKFFSYNIKDDKKIDLLTKADNLNWKIHFLNNQIINLQDKKIGIFESKTPKKNIFSDSNLNEQMMNNFEKKLMSSFKLKKKLLLTFMEHDDEELIIDDHRLFNQMKIEKLAQETKKTNNSPSGKNKKNLLFIKNPLIKISEENFKNFEISKSDKKLSKNNMGGSKTISNFALKFKKSGLISPKKTFNLDHMESYEITEEKLGKNEISHTNSNKMSDMMFMDNLNLKLHQIKKYTDKSIIKEPYLNEKSMISKKKIHYFSNKTHLDKEALIDNREKDKKGLAKLIIPDENLDLDITNKIINSKQIFKKPMIILSSNLRTQNGENISNFLNTYTYNNTNFNTLLIRNDENNTNKEKNVFEISDKKPKIKRNLTNKSTNSSHKELPLINKKSRNESKLTNYKTINNIDGLTHRSDISQYSKDKSKENIGFNTEKITLNDQQNSKVEKNIILNSITNKNFFEKKKDLDTVKSIDEYKYVTNSLYESSRNKGTDSKRKILKNPDQKNESRNKNHLLNYQINNSENNNLVTIGKTNSGKEKDVNNMDKNDKNNLLIQRKKFKYFFHRDKLNFLIKRSELINDVIKYDFKNK